MDHQHSDRIQTITAWKPSDTDRRGSSMRDHHWWGGHSLNQNGCCTSESDRYLNNDDLDGDGDFNSRDHCNGKSNNIQGFPLHSSNCQILSDQKIENCNFEWFQVSAQILVAVSEQEHYWSDKMFCKWCFCILLIFSGDAYFSCNSDMFEGIKEWVSQILYLMNTEFSKSYPDIWSYFLK